MSFTSVHQPWLGHQELEYVTEAVADARTESQDSPVRRFESEFARHYDVAYGTACSSGTAALTLALRALGIGPGDEVIVPEFTMIATAWAVDYVGATPVFVDCGDDLTIDVALIEERITPRTKVIVPVHVYGRGCDMDRIMDLAHDHNLRVVEDSAAQGLRPVADIGCFSLCAGTLISAGEGGICLTDDESLAQKMSRLRSVSPADDHGAPDGSCLRAALAQLRRLDEITETRRALEKRYDEELGDIDGITIMPPRDVLWVYDLRAERREGLREFLAREGIETRLFFKPMSRQPGYYDPRWTSLNAGRFSADGFHLPAHPELTEREQEHITGKIREFYGAR